MGKAGFAFFSAACYFLVQAVHVAKLYLGKNNGKKPRMADSRRKDLRLAQDRDPLAARAAALLD